MTNSEKMKFGWLLTSVVYSEQGKFKLRVFLNKDKEKYVGVLKGERIGKMALSNSKIQINIRGSAFERYEVFGDSLKELYDDVTEHIDSISGKCTSFHEVERRQTPYN